MSESLRKAMAVLTPDQLPAVKQAAADAAERYFVSETMNFPAEAQSSPVGSPRCKSEVKAET